MDATQFLALDSGQRLAKRAEVREQDRLRCQQLFETHCVNRGLSLRYDQEIGSYVSGETREAWIAWCAAIGLPMYLKPGLSDVDWWVACADRRPPNGM